MPRGRRLLFAAGLAIAAVPCARAQLTPPVQSDAALAGGSSSTVLGQRGWDIQPKIGVDFTRTDNVSLQATDKQSDLITRVSPGVTLQGQSARARAYVDFSVQQIMYAQSEGKDRTQRALNGTGTVELVDKWLYVDVTGRISRQAISAFGTPASGSDSINANVVESRMYQASPYIQGRLFGDTDYKLRFDNTWYSMQNNGPMNDTTIQSVQGNLSGATALSKLNWSLGANAQQTTYSNNAQNKTDDLRGSLTYVFDPQFRFTVIGGQESNDYIDFKQQTTNITGWGFDWAPTDRTLLNWTYENRYFGKGYNFNFTHHTAHTSWRLSDSRDAMLRPPQSMTFAMGTYFDLLNAQLASTIPDETERLKFIQTLLFSAGIPPDSQVIGGFTSSRATINNTKEISFTWTGVRNVITFSALSLDRKALGTGVGIPADDFSNFNLDSIRQKGINANWSHKLTPTAALTVIGTRSFTSGNTNALDSDRSMYTVTLSNKLGVYTSGSIGYRRTEASGTTNYTENAFLASVLVVF